jgi:16S rRNA (cytosine1402-N4)-methyltransferase
MAACWLLTRMPMRSKIYRMMTAFTFVDQNFRYLKNFCRLHGVIPVDGILADLGVSSYQFDQAERGFSIRFDAELDMRMNQVDTLSAKEVVNTYAEAELHRIFGIYGEIQNAKSLAKTIVTARIKRAHSTVADLKNAIINLIPRGKENKYLAQVFQALRIEVNQELEALKDFLYNRQRCWYRWRAFGGNVLPFAGRQAGKKLHRQRQI